MALILCAATASLAAPITVPTGLNPGDQYRLVFVTSTTLDATSTDIADYNALVTAAANAVPELLALGTTWTAIGSTSSVDARDNTNTNPGTWAGVEIYLLDDSLIATDNSDLWDGVIPTFLNVDETGSPVGFAAVWTGTDRFGAGLVGFRLGEVAGGVGHGSTGFVTQWVDAGISVFPSSALSVFGLSGVLTVVPEPSTALLLGGGLLGLAVNGRRRKA